MSSVFSDDDVTALARRPDCPSLVHSEIRWVISAVEDVIAARALREAVRYLSELDAARSLNHTFNLGYAAAVEELQEWAEQVSGDE